MKFQWRKLTRKERGGSKYKYEVVQEYHLWGIGLGGKYLYILGTSSSYSPLNEPAYVHYYLSGGLLEIHSGYRWNGSNVVFDTRACMRASCVHDVGYQLMQLGKLDISYRDYFDQMYRDMCIEDGMWRWHANIRYWGLKHFAGKYAKAKNS